MSSRDAMIEAIRALPDDATPDDILAALDARFGLPEVPGEVVSEAEAEAAWAPVINRRLEELLTGKVKGIPGEEVFPELRDPDE